MKKNLLKYNINTDNFFFKFLNFVKISKVLARTLIKTKRQIDLKF